MKILGAFKWLWRWATGAKAKAILALVDEIADFAVPVVAQLAKLTQAQVDDKLAILLERYHLKLHEWLAIPSEQQGPLLMDLAIAELRPIFPQAQTQQLRAGIELALSVARAKD